MVAAVVPAGNVGMPLLAGYFAAVSERAGRRAPSIFQTTSLVTREGSEADGR